METIATIAPLGKRIAIIGPPGAGKTMLAEELSSILEIKRFHLDRLFWNSPSLPIKLSTLGVKHFHLDRPFWRRGWKAKSRDTRIDILQKLVGEKQWIIEGYYLKSSKPRLEAAETIIFLDMPALLCLRRLFERHSKQTNRHDIPLGSNDQITPYSLLKILSYLLRRRFQLLRELKKYKQEKQIVYLRSSKEVATFLTEQASTE